MIDEYHIATNWDRYEGFRLKRKTGLTTGFPAIDKAIRALPGITTLVGATGLGKSYFTMNVYLHLARQGIPIILVDKEIGFVDMRTRLISCLGELTEPAITSGKLVNDEAERYQAAVEELHNLPIYYFDTIKPEEVEPYINEVGKLYKKRVFLVIDSINRLLTNFEDRRSDIDQWMTLFNNLKLKYDNFLNIWIICEKNKEGEIKESGTVEYIGELNLDLIESKDKKSIALVCKKQRNGPKGIIAKLRNVVPFCYRMEEEEYVPE